MADLARNVAGDRLLVESITKPGAEIHSYQFTPSDIVKTKGAKLIIENGLGLEAWFSKFMSSTGDIPNVKLTCLLYTSPSPRDRTRSRMPSSA